MVLMACEGEVKKNVRDFTENKMDREKKDEQKFKKNKNWDRERKEEEKNKKR
jgi:hypothetical protein